MADLKTVEARLIKTVSDDGIMEMQDYCQVGDLYIVCPETVEFRAYGHVDYPGKVWHRRAVLAWSERGGLGWLPTEFFDLWDS